MYILFISAFFLLFLPLIARLAHRAYSLSILILLVAGISFSQKAHLNPLNRMLLFHQSENIEALLDSDGDTLPDEVEKSGHYPLETPFAWHQPPEADLFHPWQRFTVASDYRPFVFGGGFTFNAFDRVFVSPAGYLSFGRPLNSPALQDYPLANALRRTIPQIAFAQGPNRVIPQLESKVYFSAPDRTTRRITFEKLFLDTTNSYASIQATLYDDGRIGLAYQDITGNLAETRRIGWQLNGGGINLGAVTNRAAFTLHPFTPTDPNAPDTDHDGLSDHEELFVYHTDPTNPSTANDGFPDGWKVAHTLTPAEPILPDTDTACFGPDWPDASPSPFDPADPRNLPLTLHIETSRPAWLTLTWHGSDTATRRLPIVGNQTLSIPIPRHTQTALTATLAPATETPGPWRYTLRAQSPDPEWPILLPGGTTPRERGVSTLPLHGLEWLETTAARTLSTESPPPRTLNAILLNAPESAYDYCHLHQTEEIRLSLPPVGGRFAHVDWHSTPSQLFAIDKPELVFTPSDIPLGTYTLTATCYPTDPKLPNLLYRVHIVITYWESLPPADFHGASWYADHIPGESLAGDDHTAPQCHQCQLKASTLLIAGFDHEKVNTRNLQPHPEETAASLIFDHCVGVDYDSGGIDLSQFLHPTSKPYLSEFSWDVGNNEILYDNPRLYTSEPKEFYPEIREIQLRNLNGTVIYDRLFLIVLNPKTRRSFNAWRNANDDTTWVNALPFPPSSLNRIGTGMPPRYNTPQNWQTPDYFDDEYYHHLAYLEIRTSNTYNTHAHQACYDQNGQLINGGVSAGSADWAKSGTRAHRNADVYPFIWALQLDGNPTHPDNSTGWFTESVPTHLTHPIIYEGSFTTNYFLRRPPHVQ